MPPAILIADDAHPSLLPLLTGAGFTYDYQPAIDRATLLRSLAPFEGLIIRSKTRVDAELLAHAPNLQFIGRAGAGLDLIDLTETERRGIRVFHASAGNADAVAEHVMAMLLGLFRNLLRADRQVRQSIWDREGNRGYELGGKTVGLLGYGHNGQATARRLSGFGCRVLAYDKYRDNYGDAYAEAATLEQIQAEADVLSMHVPLTAETRGWINATFIAHMTKPFYFINIARGEVASLADVADALRSGKLLGACLDVLENEKLATLSPAQQHTFDYLRQQDNVLFSPHIAGWTYESYQRINEVLVAQFRGVF